MRTADVVVLGGGIVGAACARECAEAGMSVIVVEPSETGGGATAAGMGHLVVLDDPEAQFALTRYSMQIWREWLPALPAGAEWLQTGTLWVAADDEEMQAARVKHAAFHACGEAAELLDAAALAEAEPNLRPDLAGGLLVPRDAVVYAPVVTAWLLRGIAVRRGTAVSVERGVVRLSDGGTIEGGTVVVAAGTWSRALVRDVPVRPRKGQLAITDRYPGFVRHQLVELGYIKLAHGHALESVAFNVQPRPTGQVLIGSSRQYDIESPEVELRFLARMLRRCVEYMPGLARMSVIRTWTGFRAATPDGLPLIGPVPGAGRLWLATGHEGLGITTAPATGRLVARALAGVAPPISPEPYLPSRLMSANGGDADA